jgi:hypothetical protein
MIAQNCREDDPAEQFVDEIRMWVYEEEWQVGGPRLQAGPQARVGAGLGHRRMPSLVQALCLAATAAAPHPLPAGPRRAAS